MALEQQCEKVASNMAKENLLLAWQRAAGSIA
jgi:hypothetical protein